MLSFSLREALCTDLLLSMVELRGKQALVLLSWYFPHISSFHETWLHYSRKAINLTGLYLIKACTEVVDSFGDREHKRPWFSDYFNMNQGSTFVLYK